MYKYGKYDTEYKDIVPVGKMVLIEKIKPSLDRVVGGIIVPYLKNKNSAGLKLLSVFLSSSLVF